jgi:hypothetical protein
MTKSNVLTFIVTLVLAAAVGFGIAEFTTAPLPVAFSAAGIIACAGALIVGKRRQAGLAAASPSRTLVRSSSKPAARDPRSLSSRDIVTKRDVAPAPKPQPQGNFTINADMVEGQPTVIVYISGFSGSDFKSRVRPALERVSSVKWTFPKNLKDGRRQMTGTVRGGTLDSAIADVRSAASRFGA